MTRDPRAAAMPERELQEAVRRMCADLGLFHYHPHNSRRSAPGWPDSTIIGRSGILHRELKDRARQPVTRTASRRRAHHAGWRNWRVWRPRDLLDGSIGRELADLAAVQLELFGGVS